MATIHRARARVAPVACFLALTALTALTALAPPLAAQSSDAQRIAAAQSLYEQATADMDAKRYESACRTLEEVVRLVPDGLGAKLTLGECYLALGKRASAWSEFITVEALASKMPGQAERAKRAGEKAAALKSALATLTIDVPEAVRAIPGLTVVRDGTPLGEVQWGKPVPVDAGDHSIVVSAPGRKTSTMSVAVKTDGDKVVVAVSAPDQAEVTHAADAPALSAPSRPYQRPLGIAAMGLGAAGLAVGAILGGRAIATNGSSNRDGHCDASDACDASGLALRDQARGFATASTIAFVAGGVVLAGGIVIFATAPRRPTATAEARVALSPTGLLVRGSW